MAQAIPAFSLNDGRSIPQLGLGVWQVDPEITARVVGDAISAGYRAIDTAAGYQNEEGVGDAIRHAGIPRGELFITSKLRNGGHARDLALRSFDETMARLGLEQLVRLVSLHGGEPHASLLGLPLRKLAARLLSDPLRDPGAEERLAEDVPALFD